MSTWKEISRVEWKTSEDDTTDTREKTKVGCLQRIAEAMELMARSHRELIEERDQYKRWYEQQLQTTASLNFRDLRT